ncbi:MAG: cell division protein FtsL [Thermodesulfobacteriota bacterium]
MKRKKKREPIRFLHFLAALFVVILLAGIFHVWVNFKRTQTGYELSQLKSKIAEEKEYNRRLKLELAYLKSPQYVERKAVKEFGLQHPSPKQVVHLP